MKLEKLTHELVSGLIDAGYDKEPREIQSESIPKIKSGSDLYILAPEGSGKTTAIAIGVIQQLKEAFEEAPRAIIMVSNQEKAFELEKQFEVLGRHTNLRTFVVFDKGILQYQKNMIYEGLDILIGTPNRLIELVKITGIPMTKVKMFVIDDADKFALNSYGKYIYRIANNVEKAQIIIVAKAWVDTFPKLSERIMKNPLVVKIK